MDVIEVPAEHMLRHMLQPRERLHEHAHIHVIPASEPPTFTTPFYLANIGSQTAPMLLELRFAETDHGFWIALLMTNERYPRDLTAMAKQIVHSTAARGIEYDAVIAPESLGAKLSQEVARMNGPFTVQTTLQKGKPRANPDGSVIVGSPKAWVSNDAGVVVTSGTSHAAARQMLYLDPLIAERLAALPNGVLLVDDARLSSGTVTSSIQILHKMRVKIAAIATVLNEHDPVNEIEGTRYIWLTKLPIFDRDVSGWHTRPGSYEGLEYFYVETFIG
jgi:adenine/guanine phosphoribosyltransferase-like PRPP-binding protein